MELTIGPRAFGLPTFDIDSLVIMTACRIYNIRIKFVESKNPWRSPSYELPFLKDNNGKKVAGLQEIMDQCLLNELKEGSQFDSVLAMIEEKLKPALEHYFWVDSQNFTEFIRPWYAKATIFPLSMIVPTNKHKYVTNKLYFCHGENFCSDKDREFKIYKEAQECINLLSTVLGEKEYFNDKTPSIVDALVFGYLAPLLKAPFPNKHLQQHVKNCTNLASFCDKMLNMYFPLSPEEIQKVKKEEEMQKENQKVNDLEFPNRTRNGILTAVATLTAMVAYAFVSGLIVIQLSDENEEKQIGVDHDNEYENSDL